MRKKNKILETGTNIKKTIETLEDGEYKNCILESTTGDDEYSGKILEEKNALQKNSFYKSEKYYHPLGKIGHYIRIKNKIDSGYPPIWEALERSKMANTRTITKDEKLALLKKNKSNIKYDSKTRGFVSIGKNDYKANHYARDICSSNEIPVAYSTNYSTNSMGFRACSIEKIDKLFVLERDAGLYEVLDDTSPRKLFFDVDFYDGTIDEYYTLKSELYGILNIEGIPIDDSMVCEYGYIGEKKGRPYISYHIIVNNGLVFKDQAHLKNTIEYLIIKHPKITELIDCVIYNKFRNFRLPYQSKGGKKTSIQRPPYPIVADDVLITYKNNKKYPNCDYYKIYDPSTLEKCFSATTGKLVKINKKRTHNNLTHTAYATTFASNYTIDIGENDETLEYIIKSIPNNPRVGYDVWMKIGMALYRVHQERGLPMSEGLSLWIDWTKSYDENTNYSKMKSIYNGFNSNGYGMKTLVEMAKVFNPKFAKKKRDPIPPQYIVPAGKYKNTALLETRYISDGCDFENILSSHRITLVRSPMGTGKTFGARSILCDDDTSILYLSCKRAFCASIYEDLRIYGFDNYMNFEGDEKGNIKNSNKILCSIESIHLCRSAYDYVILDECETLFSNITGEMNLKNSPITNLIKLSKIIRSGRLVLMDAYLGVRTMDFVDEFLETHNIADDDLCYVNNTFVYPERTYVECRNISVDGKMLAKKKDIFKSEIMKAVSRGEKITICSSSNALLAEIELELIKRFPTLKYKYYSKNNPLKLGTNVDEVWDNIDVLMYSPTITAGISYDYEEGKNRPFDRLFIYVGTHAALARDIIQAHKRVRHFTNSEITLCVMFIKNMVEYEKYPIEMKTIKEHQKHFTEDLYKEGVYTIAEQNSIKWVDSVYYNNVRERNVNETNLPLVMEEFLAMENIIKTGNCSMDNMEWCDEEIQHDYFDSIEDISLCDYETLDAKVRDRDYEDMSDEEWSRFTKSRYKNLRTDPTLSEEVLAEYYDKNCVPNPLDFGNTTKSTNIHYFLKSLDADFIKDIKLDVSSLFEELNQMPLEDAGVVELADHRVKKTQLILEMMRRMKIYNPDTRTLDIDREFNTLEIESMIEDFGSIRYSSINKLLMYSCLKNSNTNKKIFTLDNMKSMINAVMRDEFNLEITPPITTKKITIVEDGVKKRKNVKTFRLAQLEKKCDPSGKVISSKEVLNGFKVYRHINHGWDRREEEIDFIGEEDWETTDHYGLDEIVEQEKPKPTKKKLIIKKKKPTKLKIVKKKDPTDARKAIIKKYHSRRTDDADYNKKLTLEMNDELRNL